MRLHRMRWLLQDIGAALRAGLVSLCFGPSCCDCGARASHMKHALALGWRWTTQYDGEPSWLCRECRMNDQENLER